jgi:predicted MFS family arabinose efflux permease
MARNRWIMLALLFSARTAMGFQFQSVGSTGPILIDALAVEYAAIGTLIGLYLLPGVFVSLPSGMLAERFGAERFVAAGLLLMVAGGVFMGAGTGFSAVAVGRLISGIGAVLINVLLTKMVADWFAGHEIATAMAILVTSWPVGIGLGLLALVPLAHWLGWQVAMLAPALLALICVAMIAALYRDPPSAAIKPGRITLDLSGREWLTICVAGLVWATYNVGYILLISFLPAHLARQGYTLASANALVSWLGWSLIGFVPLGGYVADRFRRPDAVMVTGFLVAGVAPHGWPPTLPRPCRPLPFAPSPSGCRRGRS